MVRLALAIAAVTLGVLSVATYALQYRTDDRFSKDFALDYVSARAFLDGRDPYTPVHELVADYLRPPASVLENNVLGGANWHTPIKIVLTAPLALLPYQAAGVAWLFVSAACYLCTGAVLARGLGGRKRTGVLVAAAALIIPVVQKDLAMGNVNAPILLLISVAWLMLRERRELAAGLAIGGAAAIKFFPAFLLLPLVAARRWRAPAAAASSTAVLSAIGVALVGVTNALALVHAGGSTQGFAYWDASPANVGWWGLASRWLSPNGWVPHLRLGALGLALALAGVAALTLMALRPRASFSEDAFWASVPLMLLAWPIVWDHYLVLALPWLLMCVVRELQRGARPRRLLLLTLVAIPIAVGLPPFGPALSAVRGWQAATYLQLPTLGLLGAVALERRRVGTEPETPTSSRAAIAAV
jgi:hypothetical protein